jgi:hypothetical protein
VKLQIFGLADLAVPDKLKVRQRQLENNPNLASLFFVARGGNQH